MFGFVNMSKRLIDIVFAAFGLIVLSLPMVIIAILIRVNSPGPAFFWSKRMGRLGRPFDMPKFRTMRVGTPLVATDDLSKPDQHVTSLGRVLRKTSLDELPQLFSVLVGTMSLVGPRPVLLSQKSLISKRSEIAIDLLRPGLTGWAQINGRDELDDDEKIQFEFEYLQRQSIAFDLYIILKSVGYVMKTSGIKH